MQSLGAVTYAQLSGAGQTTTHTLEIWDGAAWVDLTDFDNQANWFNHAEWAKPFTLTVDGTAVAITRTEVKKVGGSTAWDSQAYSAEGYTDGCAVYFRGGATNKNAVMGLTSDPAASASYNTVDYCWVFDADATAWIFENGTSRLHTGTITTSTEFLIVYDGANVRYFMDGVLMWTTARALGDPLYLDSSFYQDGAHITNIAFGPTRRSYVKSLSLQLGGAGATPDPIAAEWSAEIHNADGIFHPRHPTSAYSDYLRVGRKVRISYGGTYGGSPVYWQRMIGYMDPPTFNSSDQTVSIGGGDYMTALADTELHSPNNYWGAVETFSSVISTDVLGSELYTQNDAAKNSPSDFDTMASWSNLSHATIASVADDEGTGDLGGYNAELTKTASGYTTGWASHETPFSVTVGKLYKVSFRYKRVSSGCTFSLRVYETATSNLMGTSGELNSATWAAKSFYFTATKSCVARLAAVITSSGTALVCRFDLVSIKEVTSYTNERYAMPEGCNGVYAATLDGVSLWYGETDPPRGWLYDPVYNTFYFADGYYVTGGTDNLLVYYYTTQDVMDVLGDVLAATPLYADRAAALAALNYIDPVVTIDKTWFDTGTSALAAVQLICERCGYRFWFAYDGTPTFLPAPTLDDPIVSLETRHADGLSTLQDLGEIRNNVVIQGIERGAFSTAKDKDTSRMQSAAALDATSIAAYLERTHVTTNHLFQDQTSLDAAATTMLAAFKDPKWYATLDVPHNPIPLELGDTVGFKIPLSATLEVETRGIIRDISLSDAGFTYKVEMESGLMNIANYTTATVAVTTEQCKGWVLTNAGAGAGVHLDLPAAVAGMKIIVYVAAAYAITIDPNGTDQIMVLTGTAGDYLASDAVVGSYIVLGCLAANKWYCMDKTGTWTEE